ncbi:hypothetical protein GTU79_17220 [Sodalis ligni]|uniref:hypothetical protein n=1 Tax=Sodalis ligni TaxID=2697027 RepID=UPI001BDF3650|nr:hypothetical protein [Sodalis ligni]QWA09178.1 hypothetical protein GTU79_17220 [Sodalis ligni]
MGKKKTDDNHSREPQRVRHELCFRGIKIANKTRVAKDFWRIEFVGSDLKGFNSLVLTILYEDRLKERNKNENRIGYLLLAAFSLASH